MSLNIKMNDISYKCVESNYYNLNRELIVKVSYTDGSCDYEFILQLALDMVHLVGPGTPDIVAAYPEQGQEIQGAVRFLGIDIKSGAPGDLGWSFRNTCDIEAVLGFLGYVGQKQTLYTYVSRRDWDIMGYIYEDKIGLGIYPNPQYLGNGIMTEPVKPHPSPISRWLDRFLGFPDSVGTRIFWPMNSAAEVQDALARIEQELA